MAAISRKMTAASLLTDAIEILRQSLFIKRNAGQGSRFKAAFVRHFFNFDIWEQTAFGKISVVYGQIDENGSSVRKWLARKMAITDKMVKNGRLSVKIQLFRTRFYGQMLQKEACVRKSPS